jgi:hypothetical protein
MKPLLQFSDTNEYKSILQDFLDENLSVEEFETK